MKPLTLFAYLLFALPSIAAAQDVDFLGDPLPEHALIRMGTERFVSPGGIKGMVLLQDDSIVVTVGSFVTGWDAKNGKQLWRHDGSTLGARLPTSYGLRAIDKLPDDLHFLTPGPNHSITKWNAKTGEREKFGVSQFALHFSSPMGCVSIDVSPNGKMYAVGNALGLRVTDQEGEQYFRRPGAPRQANANLNGGDRLHFGGPFTYAIFAPDSKTLAHVHNGEPKFVVIRDAETGKELAKLLGKANIVRMDFSPDGKRLATTQRDTTVRVYDVESAKLIWEFAADVDKTIENYTSAIKYSPDGSRLAVAERQQNIFVLDASNGKQIGEVKNHSWNPWALAFTSDGKSFFSSGWGGVVHRWETETQKQIPIPNAIAGTSVVAFSRDGKTIAHCDQSGHVHLIDAKARKQLRTLELEGASFEYLVFSPDNQYLAAGGNRNKNVHLAIWNYKTGKLVHSWDWEKGNDSHAGVEEIDFSHDGTMVAAASFRQNKAHVWNVVTGEKLAEVSHRNVYGLSFLSDDSRLVTAGWDKTIRYWDMEGKSTQEFLVPDGLVGDERMYTVSIDPSGEILATTHLSGDVTLWNADDHQRRFSLKPQGRFVFGSSCFSRDGLWFATGASGELQIWDAWSGTEMHRLRVSDDDVYTVEFGADNRTLVTGASSLSYQWDLRPTFEERPLKEHVAALIDNDDHSTYNAWWALISGGDMAVEAIEDRVVNVSKTVDVGRLISASPIEQRDRRQRLLVLGLGKKNDTLRLAAVKRILSVLAHINSPKSKALLQRIANQSADLEKLTKFVVTLDD